MPKNRSHLLIASLCLALAIGGCTPRDNSSAPNGSTEDVQSAFSVLPVEPTPSSTPTPEPTKTPEPSPTPFQEKLSPQEESNLANQGMALLADTKNQLIDWQWIDEKNLILVLSDGGPVARVVRYTIADKSAALLGEGYDPNLRKARSNLYTDRVEFVVGSNLLTIYREDLRLEFLPAVDEATLLPMSNEGAGYGGLAYSSGGARCFYEQFPTGVFLGDTLASDALIVAENGQEQFRIPFPFDVTLCKKTARWVPFSEDILVMAELLPESEDGDFVPTCILYDGRSGNKISELRPQPGLLMRDCVKDRLLYQQENSLIVYDYKTAQSALLSISGGASGARFSPSGEQVAYLPEGVLVPAVLPVGALSQQSVSIEKS